MADRVGAVLAELDGLKGTYGGDAGGRKLALLQTLERRRLRRAGEVLGLHEALCFLRAYPDDAAVLAVVERMLAAFERRGDLRRFREELADSGIAGTDICFPFFPETAGWVARRWGESLAIDWEAVESPEKIERLPSRLALYCETPGLDECAFEVREWLARMKGPGETDAVFLLRRLGQLGMDTFEWELLLEDVDVPFVLSPGVDTPARTREKVAGAAVTYQSGALDRSRPSIKAAVARRPRSVRAAGAAEGRALVDLARGAMATRGRDLDAFAYGDPKDVRVVDCGGGLLAAHVGVVPARRFLLETLYGFLLLKNGVPVGYGTYSGLFGSAEVAFTVFDTFRMGEAARMYGHVLAHGRQLYGFDTFLVDPYQLGEEKDDAIKSGAWWFYAKLGFLPREAGLLRIMRRELGRMRAKRSHRSSAATLKTLATANVYLHLGKRREDVLGVMSMSGVGLRVTQYLSERFGHDRRGAETTCAKEAAKRLGVRSMRGFSPGEQLAWRRWGPLVAILPGLDGWSAADKKALAAVVRAKGGRRESDYLLRFDRHRRLRRAIRSLARAVD